VQAKKDIRPMPTDRIVGIYLKLSLYFRLIKGSMVVFELFLSNGFIKRLDTNKFLSFNL
jgi:hypothetical protein